MLLLLSIAGFLISLYGFSIEQKLKTNPNYKPMCDISDRASCTNRNESRIAVHVMVDVEWFVFEQSRSHFSGVTGERF